MYCVTLKGVCMKHMSTAISIVLLVCSRSVVGMGTPVPQGTGKKAVSFIVLKELVPGPELETQGDKGSRVDPLKKVRQSPSFELELSEMNRGRGMGRGKPLSPRKDSPHPNAHVVREAASRITAEVHSATKVVS